MELSVTDVTTGEGFHIEVAPGTAMEAFHHPYAYAARRESASHRDAGSQREGGLDVAQSQR